MASDETYYVSDDLTDWALAADVNPASAKLLLVALARHANRKLDQPDTLHCFPGQELLQKYLCDCSRSQVTKMLGVLIEGGFIEVVGQQRSDSSRFTSNVYKVLYTEDHRDHPGVRGTESVRSGVPVRADSGDISVRSRVRRKEEGGKHQEKEAPKPPPRKSPFPPDAGGVPVRGSVRPTRKPKPVPQPKDEAEPAPARSSDLTQSKPQRYRSGNRLIVRSDGEHIRIPTLSDEDRRRLAHVDSGDLILRAAMLAKLDRSSAGWESEALEVLERWGWSFNGDGTLVEWPDDYASQVKHEAMLNRVHNQGS